MSKARTRVPDSVNRPISNPDDPAWLRQVADDIQALLRLPPGWDSYGAMRIDPRAASAAFRLLSEIMQDNSPAPSAAPLSDSGIQLDWHTRGIDVELMISQTGRASVWCRDRQTGIEWDGEPTRGSPTSARLRETMAELGRRSAPS